MQTENLCDPGDFEWEEDEPYYDWDYPDWREESGWNDMYGADVEASDIIEFRDWHERMRA